MKGIDEVDAFIIGLVAEPISAVEDDIFCTGAEARVLKDAPQLDAVPFADRAPALDAVVASDLGAVGKGAKRAQWNRQRPRYQPVNDQPPVGELLRRVPRIFGRAWDARAVRTENRRQV